MFFVFALLFITSCADSPSQQSLTGRDAEIINLVQGDWVGDNGKVALNYKFNGNMITTWTSAAEGASRRSNNAFNNYNGHTKEFWVEDGVIYFREYTTAKKLDIKLIDKDTLKRNNVVLHRVEGN